MSPPRILNGGDCSIRSGGNGATECLVNALSFFTGVFYKIVNIYFSRVRIGAIFFLESMKIHTDILKERSSLDCMCIC